MTKDPEDLVLSAPSLMTKAREMIAEIDDLAENADLPVRATDFAASVQDRANAIGETLDTYGDREPSDAQLEALANMRDGLRKWFRER